MYTLNSGEPLIVDSFIPGKDAGQHRIEAIRDLIIQPQRPWFSTVERAYVEGAIEGRFLDVARDSFAVAWLDGEPVGNVCVSSASSSREIGLLHSVITAPAYRGKGIAPILMREAVARFEATGGVCLHLGTENPSAHRIYEACGFRDYNGHVMRYLRGDRDWHDFDGQYFADSGTAVVRAGHWGDLARVGMLYAAPHPWFVKDYPERLYCSPAIVQRRVGSILPAMMLNASEKNGGLWVLENSAQRVVGAATVARLDQTAQRHAPILDFLVAPAYVCQAPDLISAAVAALRGSDATMVRACLASCDGEKADIVRLAGFQLDARLPGQFVAGQDHFDLHIYARSVP